MELPDVEVVPQLILRHLPQFEDLDLTDLVGRGLARPGDVARDFRPGNVHGDHPGHDELLPHSPEALLAGGGVVQHVLHRLLLCPAKRVHPSVHNWRGPNVICYQSILSGLPRRQARNISSLR